MKEGGPGLGTGFCDASTTNGRVCISAWINVLRSLSDCLAENLAA